ncbi:MAG: rhamnulokinase [Anaerolineae bacterium]|nr:rhamnulokinase [Anaerolineae bacterium]
MTTTVLAFDLGAESGRAVVGHIEDDRLHLAEIHRFPNEPVRIRGSLHWDVLRLWHEIKQGLGLAAQKVGTGLAAIGLDTWGVDFALLAADDTLLGNPIHYRDPRTEGLMEAAFQIVPRAEIYRRTGIQFMPLNTLYQLFAMARAGAPALAAATTFLNIPDLFNFWLCGRKANEFTVATTTQCYDPRAGDWARDLLDRLGIPAHIFGGSGTPIVPPGTLLGDLSASVCDQVGSPPIPVIASASHDTASAVAAVPAASAAVPAASAAVPAAGAAVPAAGADYIYLSSGTWSLMGIEQPEPLITDQSLAYDFTNEGGVGGTFRVLKNIAGLWLVQECRRAWARAGHTYRYDDLTAMAAAAPPFGPLISPSDPRFLAPGDMPTRLQAYCHETGQPVPETRGQIVRCALESLALEYRRVAACLQELAGRPLATLHIVGGGSQNTLLNQLTADATGRTVVAGPVEATAIGNVLVQAIALGHLPDLAAGRALVRRSFALDTYEPRHTLAWDEAYERYLKRRA